MTAENAVTKRSRKLVRLRQASQWLFFILFVWACHRSLRLFFETNPSLFFFTSISVRKAAGSVFTAVLMLAVTAVLGRFFCGWICPMGSLIDAVGSLRRRKKWFSDAVNRRVRMPKFIVWAALLALAAGGIQYAWALDPITIAGRFMALIVTPVVAYAVDGIFRLGGMLPLAGEWLGDLGRDLALGEPLARSYGTGAAWAMAGLFLAAISCSLWIPRIWCRSVCPLGAFYSLASRWSLLERHIRGCTSCRKCARNCRMGAIKDDGQYVKSECILCLDCVYDCPTGITWFGLGDSKKVEGRNGGRGVTRAQFLALTAVPLVPSRMPAVAPYSGATGGFRAPIRPPGSADEAALGTLCVRCGNCMKACPTNVIQPRVAAFADFLTPVMEFSVGSCSYNCRKCGEVCPTGAIREMGLEEKRGYVLGLAIVDRNTCIPFRKGEECLVCEEHCPVPDKAIKMVKRDIGNKRGVKCPEVDRVLCNGCGICQNKCPVLPVAIRVGPAVMGRGRKSSADKHR